MDTGEKVYGGCEGPEAMYVKLISSDGHEFIVKRDHALTSGTIKAMLSGPGQFSENETNEVNFREIPSHVLQKVCMYFTYKVRVHTYNTRDRDQSGFKHFRFDTQTAPLRFLSFPFPRRLLLNFLWRQTFWIVEKSGRSNMINTRHEFLMFEHFPLPDLPYV